MAEPAPALRWPATIQTLALLVAPEAWMAYLLRRFGDGEPVVRMKLIGLGDIATVSDPDSIRAVFTADRDVIRAGEANGRVLGRALGESSVLLLDGEEHLRMRRRLLPPFHGDAVPAYAAVVEAVAAREVARWRAGETIATLPRMQAIALDVILRAVVGVRDARRLERLRALLPRVLAVNPFVIVLENRYPRVFAARAAQRLPWIRARHEVWRLLDEEIAAHRADPAGREDVLALLVADAKLTDEELRSQLLTLLLAGQETTASALAWAFERLVRHPGAYARLVEEVRAGEGDAYLSAVVNETLRTRPPLDAAWRAVAQPTEISGCPVHSGETLGVAIRGVAMGESWADPRAFRPERFLNGDAPPRYALVPFGGGPRRCLGASFAVMEMKTVLRTVLERVDLRVAPARGERQARPRFTTVPGRGGRVVVANVAR